MSVQNSKIPVSTGQRSRRNLSACGVGTTDFGRLDVLYHTQVCPGEDFELSMKGVLQSAPMVVNTFGAMKYDVRAFFVPFRILTHRPENGKSNFVWDLFIQKLSNTSSPYILLGNVNKAATDLTHTAWSYYTNKRYYMNDFKRLLSQLRFPAISYNQTYGSQTPFNLMRVSPFPFMAYQRIWWDYYRNSSLIDESLLSSYIPYPLAGNNANLLQLNAWFQPRYACWDKDYFTNARPVFDEASAAAQGFEVDDPSIDKMSNLDNMAQLSDGSIVNPPQSSGIQIPVAWLRSAYALDNYLTRMNLVGSRIKDRMMARFGIKPSYQYLNQSYYLGGNSTKFSVGDYASYADTYDSSNDQQDMDNAFNLGPRGDGAYQGQRSGKIDVGIGFDKIKFHSEEYGIVMVIGSLVPRTGYYQGLAKDLTRGTESDNQDARFSFLTPELANLGLEPIATSELFVSGTATVNNNLGYTEHYGAYGFQPNVVDGDMMLEETRTGMDAFHLFRSFSSVPSLTNEFTMITPEQRLSLDRIFQIQNASAGVAPDNYVVLLDHFTRFVEVSCSIVRAMPSSWLPELYEDNNHGNTVTVDVGGSRVN